MKSIVNYAFLIGMVLLIQACSKEKKVKRFLKSGTGEWQVTAVNQKFYKNDTLKTDETYSPSEKYVFDEHGNFAKVDYLDADQTIVYWKIGGKWTNKADVLVLTYSSGYEVEIKILSIKKKEMMLEEVLQYAGPNDEKYVNTIWLERRD
jgi:hypothetical protein